MVTFCSGIFETVIFSPAKKAAALPLIIRKNCNEKCVFKNAKFPKFPDFPDFEVILLGTTVPSDRTHDVKDPELLSLRRR